MKQMTGFFDREVNLAKAILLGVILAGTGLAPSISAQPANSPAVKPAGNEAPASRYSRIRNPRREVAYYAASWGVDSLSVKAVESGELIRFTYRILDPDKAKSLNDKKIDAFLISPASCVKLVVPSLEKVGQLRQSSTPIAGNTYWMAFSNPGRPVKRGDHVNIEIGQFHVEGLVVQ